LNTIVYGLRSTACSEIRYIGQTISRLLLRLRAHRHAAFTLNRKTPVYCWMRACRARGEGIEIVSLVENGEWNHSEIELIKAYKETGNKLLNLTEGGDGTYGLTPWKGKHRSSETKAKLSLALKGRKIGPPSEEHRKRISLSLTGKKASLESRRKMSESKKRLGYKTRLGQSPSLETRLKISNSLKARFNGGVNANP
jgi:hypothetical protein